MEADESFAGGDYIQQLLLSGCGHRLAGTLRADQITAGIESNHVVLVEIAVKNGSILGRLDLKPAHSPIPGENTLGMAELLAVVPDDRVFDPVLRVKYSTFFFGSAATTQPSGKADSPTTYGRGHLQHVATFHQESPGRRINGFSIPIPQATATQRPGFRRMRWHAIPVQ